MRSIRLIAAGLLLILSNAVAVAEKRVAFVVGNSTYQATARLTNPARDAESVANMLRESGYQVTLVKDVGYLDFKRAIRAFEDSAGDADVAVIFYAGHGIEIAGTNYLIPVDAKLASDRDASDEAIDLNRLIATVDGVKRLRLIILDACRDNPFLSVMKRRQAQRQIMSGLGPVNVRSETFVAPLLLRVEQRRTTVMAITALSPLQFYTTFPNLASISASLSVECATKFAR
jgi:uncharacterized caspase-like protein